MNGKTQELKLTPNDMRIKRLYVQCLLEKAKFVPKDDFVVEAREGAKAPISIAIYVPATNAARIGTLNDIKLSLDGHGIINEPGLPNSFHLYVKYVNVEVPEDFIEEQKNQAKKVRAENGNGNGNGAKTEDVNIFAPLEKILYLHEVLAFEQSRDDQFAIFTLPDKVEALYMEKIMKSFSYGCDIFQADDFIGASVYNNPNVGPAKVGLLKDSSITDHSRFTKDLLDSILITKWEIAKSKMPVIPSSEFLANDATKSTRFTLPPTKASESLIANFVVEMEVKYGVDVQQDERDKNTFFVLTPSPDTDHVGAGPVQNERAGKKRKMKESIHQATKLLIEAGFTCHSSKVGKGVLCFQMHFFPKTKKPQKISLCYGTEEERVNVAEGMLKTLLDNGYYVVLSKNGGGIKFELPKINVVAKSLGIHQYSQTVKDKHICYSVSKVVNGWKPVAIVGTGSREGKLFVKTRFIEGLKKVGYEIRGVKPETLLFYVKVEEEVVKPETPDTTSKQSFEKVSLEEIIGEDAGKLGKFFGAAKTEKLAKPKNFFLHAVTAAFLTEMESNPELQKAVMTKLKDKIAPGLDKALVGNLLGDLALKIEAKSFPFGDAGKYVKLTDVTALLGAVILEIDK